jgi:hypothetical protein
MGRNVAAVFIETAPEVTFHCLSNVQFMNSVAMATNAIDALRPKVLSRNMYHQTRSKQRGRAYCLLIDEAVWEEILR